MSLKKPTLGRGLADLLGQAGASRPAVHPTAPVSVESTPPATPTGDELTKLPLDLLQRGKYQPRVDMRTEALEDLASSIKAQGVVQPIVVRPLAPAAPGESQRYEIIAGERRWRAAQIAGLDAIPAIVRRIPDEAAIAVALIENIQRENLNSLEEARALERLINEFQLTHQQCADAIGRSRTAVTNLLRLLEASPEVCDLVASHSLEMGHARALLGLTNKRKQAEVGALVAKKGLSVRDTEALVRRMQQPEGGKSANGTRSDAASAGSSDPDVQRLEQDLSEKLGAKVLIQHTAAGMGKLVVSYNSLDELDGILAHIK